MNHFWRAHQMIDKIAELPIINSYLRQKFDDRFETNLRSNLFRGVFNTFDEASLAAPSSRPLGYDNEAAASMYLDRTKTIYATDYPMMFWLQKLLGQGCRSIFDLGGHIGVSYYAYRQAMDYPGDLRWKVQDVPAVVAQGRNFATTHDTWQQLSFTDQFADASGHDVLIALGSLQYLPETLAERLQTLPVAPAHLVLNLTPLHANRSFFTVQGIGTAFCPYRITALPEFVRSLENIGYTLVDQWENPEKKCDVAFDPAHSLDKYHGFYFRR